MIELPKPCPFCGGEPRRIVEHSGYACSRIGCRLYHGWSYLSAWNSRPGEELRYTALVASRNEAAYLREIAHRLIDFASEALAYTPDYFRERWQMDTEIDEIRNLLLAHKEG